MPKKPEIGSFQAFLNYRARGVKLAKNIRVSSDTRTARPVVHEFKSVSSHLDDDFIELLLREARKRAEEITLKEDIEACKGCERLVPKLIIP